MEIQAPQIAYTEASSSEHRRKHAQVFTPEAVATFMINYVLLGTPKYTIHDPAFGLGIFKEVALRTNPSIHFSGNELDPLIYKFVQSNKQASLCADVKLQDYLLDSWSLRYDAIVCNPPYQKFHDFDITIYNSVFQREYGFKLSGFTNIYGLFILKSLKQLSENGRMAYIVPSEFLNSDYGVAIKEWIRRSGMLREIIIIRNDEDVFDDAMTTSSILLFENSKAPTPVKFRTLNLSELPTRNIDSFLQSEDHVVSVIDQNQLESSIKWRKHYEETVDYNPQYTIPLSTYARVSRGIATGANSYFAFTQDDMRARGLSRDSFLECITKATDVADLVFTQESFARLLSQNKKVLLFDGTLRTNARVLEYIAQGESEGIHSRHLTSKRNPWFSQEARPAADIWVGVFARGEFKFILNNTTVKNLTTFHGIYLRPPFAAIREVLFLYLLTPISRELLHGNRRVYGRGLDKFEPRDLEGALVCDFQKLPVATLERLRELATDLVTSWGNENQFKHILRSADEILRPLVVN